MQGSEICPHGQQEDNDFPSIQETVPFPPSIFTAVQQSANTVSFDDNLSHHGGKRSDFGDDQSYASAKAWGSPKANSFTASSHDLLDINLDFLHKFKSLLVA